MGVVEGYQVVSARTLVSMAWSLKIIFGLITDSFPIGGYRRRPYMVLGWSMCFIVLVIMAFTPVSDPYLLDPAYHFNNVPLQDIPKDLINEIAPTTGSKYILMMMFASIGYVLADVAADAVVVEFAQREPDASRGSTQAMVYLFRTIFSILASILIGFGMNAKEYGGSFSFGLALNEIMMILAVPAAVVIPASIWFLDEEKSPRESFAQRLHDMWAICQRRAIWQIMLVKFIGGFFQTWSVTAANPMQKTWLHVEAMNECIFGIVGGGVFAFTIYATKTWGLQWDWRRTIAITTLFTVVVDSLVSFLSIYDVVRSQWFWYVRTERGYLLALHPPE